LTKFHNVNIILTMYIYKNTVYDRDDLIFIYSGLNSISDKGREQLKNIAQSFIAIQNRPGTPVPDSIGWEIIRDSINELLKGVN
jgi:hypothetical protein